jgi:hypothetical protein
VISVGHPRGSHISTLPAESCRWWRKDASRAGKRGAWRKLPAALPGSRGLRLSRPASGLPVRSGRGCQDPNLPGAWMRLALGRTLQISEVQLSTIWKRMLTASTFWSG